MTGKYTLQLSTRRVSFKLEIRRKYTIIRGDSATGKSTLAEYISMYNTQGTDSGVYLTCDIPVKRFAGIKDLESYENSIIVIDEGDIILKMRNAADLFMNSNCYFIIITRQKLGYLPYSLLEIYEMVGRMVSSSFTESTLCNRYKDLPMNIKPDLVLTEDEGTGYDFFNRVLPIQCEHADGNSNIVGSLEKYYLQYKCIFVICDGAAIGSEIGEIMEFTHLVSSHCEIYVYTPESFEWLLLKGLFGSNKEIQEKLDNTYDYSDTSLYESWEQYYTDLLIETGKKYKKAYSKKKMVSYYYENADKVLKLITDLDLSL